MVKFFNQDEMGIEGVVGAIGNSASKAVKTAADTTDITSQDIVNQLYGIPSEQQNADEEQEIEMKPQQSQTKMDLKAKTNIRNPAAQQAQARQIELEKKGYKPDDINKLEKLRKLLHEEQVKDIFQPKQQKQEERPAEEREREEQEKKKKEQEKKVEEEKKKEDLSVVQKRTSIENKGYGAG